MYNLYGTSLYLHMKLNFQNFNTYNMEEYIYAINLMIFIITKDAYNALLVLEKKFNQLR